MARRLSRLQCFSGPTSAPGAGSGGWLSPLPVSDSGLFSWTMALSHLHPALLFSLASISSWPWLLRSVAMQESDRALRTCWLDWFFSVLHQDTDVSHFQPAAENTCLGVTGGSTSQYLCLLGLCLRVSHQVSINLVVQQRQHQGPCFHELDHAWRARISASTGKQRPCVHCLVPVFSPMLWNLTCLVFAGGLLALGMSG